METIRQVLRGCYAFGIMLTIVGMMKDDKTMYFIGCLFVGCGTAGW